MSGRNMGRCRLPLGVVGDAGPVDDHAGLIAENPGVVSGRADHEIAGAELHVFPVVHDDLHATRDDVTHVRAWQLSVLAIGLTCLDHCQPGWKVALPTAPDVTLTSSSLPVSS